MYKDVLYIMVDYSGKLHTAKMLCSQRPVVKKSGDSCRMEYGRRNKFVLNKYSENMGNPRAVQMQGQESDRNLRVKDGLTQAQTRVSNPDAGGGP